MNYHMRVANYTGNGYSTTIYGRTIESAVTKAARNLVRPKDRATMRIEPSDTAGIWNVYDQHNFTGTVTVFPSVTWPEA